MAFFDHVAAAPVDPILGLTQAFNADPRENKINLSVGLYRTADLKTTIMSCVKKAERALVENEKNKDYLPIDGDRVFIEKVGVLTFGESFWTKQRECIVGAQSVGGTSALRSGCELLKQEIGENLYVSAPTWPNHLGVFRRGGMKVNVYNYYDQKKHCLDFDRLYCELSSLAPKSIVLLHASCHNPTGADPTKEQWQILSKLFLEKNLIPFFDFAYQGFGKGLEEDAYAVRLFAELGHEMLVATSYSKNFGLYAERVGALFIVTASEKSAKLVMSQLKVIIRANYSNPSMHGAHVIAHILSSPPLKKEWEDELSSMRQRINDMRSALTKGLVAKSTKIDYSYLKDRVGLFCFCALEKEKVDQLIAEYGIYLTGDGRINVVGLNQGNLERVIDAIVALS